MARIKMPAARSKAQEITFEEAFQKLLEHSTLKTTQLYCNIFSVLDILSDY